MYVYVSMCYIKWFIFHKEMLLSDCLGLFIFETRDCVLTQCIPGWDMVEV